MKALSNTHDTVLSQTHHTHTHESIFFGGGGKERMPYSPPTCAHQEGNTGSHNNNSNFFHNDTTHNGHNIIISLDVYACIYIGVCVSECVCVCVCVCVRPTKYQGRNHYTTVRHQFQYGLHILPQLHQEARPSRWSHHQHLLCPPIVTPFGVLFSSHEMPAHPLPLCGSPLSSVCVSLLSFRLLSFLLSIFSFRCGLTPQ